MTLYGDDPTYHNHFAPRNAAAHFGFSSLSKLLDYVESVKHQSTDERRNGWTPENGVTGFTATRTMTDALDLARNGWRSGIDKAQTIIDRLTLQNPRVRQRAARVAGGRVNVGRMLSGDPKHMLARPKLPGKRRIRFFVEAGCSGAVQSSTLIERAAVVGAMIDVMENQGYSASIVVTDTSLSGGQTAYQLAVVVKEHGERLNLSDVLFAMGHPSFLRRFSFAICSSVQETRNIWSSQGMATNAFTDKHVCGDGEFYVPMFDYRNEKHLTDDPLSIMPYVVPDGLPIDWN